MIPPAMILAGVQMGQSLLSGVLGSSASKKAEKRLKEIGKLNYTELMRQAETEQELGGEQLINLLDSQARHKGTVEGMYAKSGVLMTGTPASAVQKMGEDFEYNVEQAQEGIQERVDRIRHQARMALMGAEAQAGAYAEQAKGDTLQSLFGAIKGGIGMWSAWSGGANKPNPQKGPAPFDPSQNYLLEGWQV